MSRNKRAMKNPSVPSRYGVSRIPRPCGVPSGSCAGLGAPIGMAFKEAVDLILPLLVEQGTGDVSHASGGTGEIHRKVQQIGLATRSVSPIAADRAASALRDCAARSRCPSMAHRPTRNRRHRATAPAPRARAVGRAARSRQPPPCPFGAGASCERRPRSVSAAISVPRFSIAAASARVLPPPGAQIDRPSRRAAHRPRCRRAGCRNPALRRSPWR